MHVDDVIYGLREFQYCILPRPHPRIGLGTDEHDPVNRGHIGRVSAWGFLGEDPLQCVVPLSQIHAEDGCGRLVTDDTDRGVERGQNTL